MDTTSRKISEALTDTFNFIGGITKYPLGMIKETTRPSYWMPGIYLIKIDYFKENIINLFFR